MSAAANSSSVAESAKPVQGHAGSGRNPGDSLAPCETTTPARKLEAMKSDYDAELAKAEKDIEALRPQMRDALNAWLDATAPWVAVRWGETLDTAIAYNPDVVKALGDEKRKALKERTATMIGTPRPHVEKRLVEDRPHAWPHLRDGAARRDATESFITRSDRVGGKISQTIPDSVSSMLGSLLSDMADLLEQEGFNLVRFLPGSASSRLSQKPRVAAGPGLAWSDAMMHTMAAYGRLAIAYFAGLNEREQIHVRRERAEAQELWGDA
jgi:hypothetical protein